MLKPVTLLSLLDDGVKEYRGAIECSEILALERFPIRMASDRPFTIPGHTVVLMKNGLEFWVLEDLADFGVSDKIPF